MNKVQNNESDMFSALQVPLGTLSTAADAPPALKARTVALKTGIDWIAKLAGTQKVPLRAKLSAREQAITNAADTTVIVARLVAVYAREHGKHELTVLVDVTHSDFLQLRRKDRMPLATRVLTAARSVIAELEPYGVTP